MRIPAIVSALGAAVLLGGCSDSDSRRSGGPSEAELQARELAAADSMQGLLDSYLDVIGGVTGLPDPAYFLPGFNLDGWDRSQYLAAFWNADEAADAGGGAVTIWFGDDTDYSVYDLWINSSTSPYNLSLPVVVELGMLGGTVLAGAPFSSYMALWNFFMLENPDDTFSVTAQAPTWEYEAVDLPPGWFTFNFIVNELAVNGKTVYRTVGDTNDPAFYVIKIQSVAGATFLVDVALLAVGSGSLANPHVRLEARLFYDGSPAHIASLGLGNTAFTQNLRARWTDFPFASGMLVLPGGLAAGNYTLVVRAETATDDPDEVIAYDMVTMPIEVLP
ncbi:MAG TPA: hypothetical protein DCM87_07810 [Planctomycetes bacterium]|nr:hypothetical protein [Planctomycetota bacterium]